MGLPGKWTLSVLIVLCLLLGLYISAYAFSMNPALLLAGRLGGVALGALLVAAVWRVPGWWLWPALLLVLTLAAGLLWQAGGF